MRLWLWVCGNSSLASRRPPLKNGMALASAGVGESVGDEVSGVGERGDGESQDDG